VGERFANPNTTQKRIQQRRKDDNIKNQLKKEFEAIDEDGNGFLDRQELAKYF
jgi:Ca2+-binding EF-hand superfamily protein